MPGSSASGAASRRRHEQRADRSGAGPRRWLGSVSPRARPRLSADRPRRGRVADRRGGHRYLDAVGGGAMVSSIGAGVPDIVSAAERQLREICFIYNQQFTSPAQEAARASELIALAPGFIACHFATGGAEANETAAAPGSCLPCRARRAGALERDLSGPGLPRADDGDARAHRPPRAPTSLRAVPAGLHPRPASDAGASTRAARPHDRGARRRRRRAWRRARSPPSSASRCPRAALPAFRAPGSLLDGIGERREAHGFLICLDEVVTGIGRTGTWFAARAAPDRHRHRHHRQGARGGLRRDTARALPAHVYDAIAQARAASNSAIPGTAPRCRAPSAWL